MFKPFVCLSFAIATAFSLMSYPSVAAPIPCEANGHTYSDGSRICAPASKSDGGGPVVLYCSQGGWSVRHVGPNHVDTCAQCIMRDRVYSEGAVITDKQSGITQRCNGGTWAWLSSLPVHGQKIRFSISARNDQPVEPAKSMVLPAGNWNVKLVNGDYQTWSGDTNNNKFCISFFVASDTFEHSPGHGHGVWGNEGVCKPSSSEALAASQDLELDLNAATSVTFSIINSPHDNSGGLSFEVTRRP